MTQSVTHSSSLISTNYLFLEAVGESSPAQLSDEGPLLEIYAEPTPIELFELASYILRPEQLEGYKYQKLSSYLRAIGYSFLDEYKIKVAAAHLVRLSLEKNIPIRPIDELVPRTFEKTALSILEKILAQVNTNNSQDPIPERYLELGHWKLAEYILCPETLEDDIHHSALSGYLRSLALAPCDREELEAVAGYVARLAIIKDISPIPSAQERVPETFDRISFIVLKEVLNKGSARNIGYYLSTMGKTDRKPLGLHDWWG